MVHALHVLFALAALTSAKTTYPSWTTMPSPAGGNGDLKSVSSGGNIVCVVVGSSKIQCGAFNAKKADVDWNAVSGELEQVVVGPKGTIIGVNNDNEVRYSSKILPTQAWIQISGETYESVSMDEDKFVCGVTPDNKLDCAWNGIKSKNPNWSRQNGLFKQVIVANGRLVGLNKDNKLYTTPTDTMPTSTLKWQAIPSPPSLLKQISYDGERVCGITTSNTVLCTTFDPTKPLDWYSVPGSNIAVVSIVPGKLEQVVVGSKRSIIGVNIEDEVWFSPKILPSQAWVQISGQFYKSVSLDNGKFVCAVVVAHGRLVGLDPWNQLFTASTGTIKLQLILPPPIILSQISYDGQRVCGITTASTILRTAFDPSKPLDWYPVPGSNIAVVSVQGNNVFASTTDSTLLLNSTRPVTTSGYSKLLYLCVIDPVPPCLDAPAGWSAVLGSLTQISVDKSVVCGLNALDKFKVYCSQKKQPASWWTLPNVAFKHMAVRDGIVFGIQTDGKLVTGPIGPTATFVEVLTPFCAASKVTVDGSTVCVVTTRNQVFCANTAATAGFPASARWQGLDGTVTQVALAGSTLYGVNGQNQLWRGIVTAGSLASGVASWTLVPTIQLQQVSYDGVRVCGVTPVQKVVCSSADGNVINGNVSLTWTTLEGELAQVSQFGASLYGVDAAGHIFYQDLLPGTTPTTTPLTTPRSNVAAAWTVVPTPNIALVTVSSFGSNVCGTDSAGSIYCSTFDANNPSVVAWVQLQGALQQVVVGAKGVLYGVNSANAIYYAPTCRATTPSWVQQWGALNNIATDGTVLCGVNRGSQVYCAWQNIQSSTPNWTLLDGSLKQLVVANGLLFGLDATNKLWTGTSTKLASGTASWKAIANSATYSQISFDGLRLCGVVTSGSKIQCADAGLATSPNWFDLPGASSNMAHVSVQRNNLFVLATNSTLLYRALNTGDVNC
ncbi:hypothetical protein DYB36_000506 [Aphanomyces astaci]|uniref:Ig-like domain-containing protein n=2 Tax=Aphanomyces astaci TaxID=112090 RepID=A0A397A7A0_APHAT|nr:hypothetical protein DYB36_000506 [Aphanomyces astaci]